MRTKPWHLIVLSCCVAALTVVYQPWNYLSARSAPYLGPPPDERIVSAHTALGFDLLHKLAAKPGENVFISPSSIATVLEMTYSGASGQTKAEMAKALHLTGIDINTVSQSGEALRLGAMGADPKVEIATANSLWAQNGYLLLPAFMDRDKRYYSAEVQNVDFGQPATTNRINTWVEQRTNGKIKRLLPKLDAMTRFVLVNAVYFHGQWTDKFQKSATQPQPFTLQNGTTKTVPMMSRSGYYTYLKTDGFEAIRLPYGSDRFAMYVFLPDAKDGLPTLLKRLDRAKWTGWLAQAQPLEGSISLPRFRVEYGKALNDELNALGICSAFNQNQADFRGITGKRDLYISLVQHKAYVDVNEEGTEAAAATTDVGVASAPPPNEPFNMVVDHPFLCAIRDDKTGEILFLGTIYNPA